MNWTITITGEYMILQSAISGETIIFLKHKVILKPYYDEDELMIDAIGTNISKKIIRTEMLSPGPQADKNTFIETLTSLLS